jgi:predicted nucleic acid-binding Zn ribbon protein
MQISSLIIGVTLLGIALYIIALPFRQKEGKGAGKSKAAASNERQRDEVLLALRDLEFDFKTGKVTEEDYGPLHAQLLAEAAKYIEAEKEEDQQLETLIQSRRKSTSSLKCESCGTPLEAGQKFCSKCGQAAKSVSCPSCGKKIHAGDLFCSSCGTHIEVKLGAAASS